MFLHYIEFVRGGDRDEFRRAGLDDGEIITPVEIQHLDSVVASCRVMPLTLVGVLAGTCRRRSVPPFVMPFLPGDEQPWTWPARFPRADRARRSRGNRARYPTRPAPAVRPPTRTARGAHGWHPLPLRRPPHAPLPSRRRRLRFTSAALHLPPSGELTAAELEQRAARRFRAPLTAPRSRKSTVKRGGRTRCRASGLRLFALRVEGVEVAGRHAQQTCPAGGAGAFVSNDPWSPDEFCGRRPSYVAGR
jgi:hypothetical protein